MSSPKTRKGSSINNIVDYTLPKLHTGKNWYIDFTCFDPADGKMRRKKYMLDSIEKISDRKKRAAEIANTIAKVLPGEISRVVKNGGIEIVDYAETPDEPTFPNVWMNTAAGAAAGFLMVCGFYLLKEYFRTKVRKEEDLREYFGMDIPILGTIPKLDK